MSTQFLVGLCIALGALGAWNTWALHQVSKRLDAIEQIDVVSTESDNLSEKRGRIGTIATREKRVFGKNKKSIKNDQDTSYRSKMNGLAVESPPVIDLSDPDIQEAIANIAENNAQKKEEQRRKSKMDAYKTSLQHELETFSNEKEYDSNIVQSIESILDESTAEWTAIREQVRDGEISWMDARTEFTAIGEETETKVTEFISAEDYKELRSRLWGDWGR